VSDAHRDYEGMNAKHTALPLLFAVFALGCGASNGGSAPGSSDGIGSGWAGSGSGGSSGSSGGGSSGGSSGSSSGSSGGSSGSSGGSSGGSSSGGGNAGALVFSPYKDTSINMNWNTNVASTSVSGSPTPIGTDLANNGGDTITMAFATGECGSENWGGVPGDALAKANVPLLTQANVKYIVSTGGAAGSFTCGSDAGFETFVGRWASPDLIGVDFDIEAGQSPSVIQDLVSRIAAAHGGHPGLRFSLTIATLANNDGASTAQSLGSGVQDSLNAYGDEVLSAVRNTFGSSWPGYVTVNLMTMDFGSASPGVCVVSGGSCDMGQSAIQAAYNLHDRWGVPYGAIELTPMIGGNDVSSEVFTLADADTIASFVKSQGLAGVHDWSYDRDVDCPPGSASPTCNSYGAAGSHGFLKRFLADGL
jgi:chitinase